MDKLLLSDTAGSSQWARVASHGAARQALFQTTHAGATLHFVNGDAPGVVLGGANAPCAVVAVAIPPHAIVLVRAHEYGTSMVVGTRADATNPRGVFEYTHHWCQGDDTIFSQVRTPLPRAYTADAALSHAFSLPLSATALELYGDSFAAPMRATDITSWSRRGTSSFVETPGAVTCLPSEAFTVAHMMARELFVDSTYPSVSGP